MEKQVDFLNKNPQIDIVGTQARIIDQDGIPRYNYEFRTDLPDLQSIQIAKKPFDDADIKKDFLMGICPIVKPSSMIRREIILHVGGYDNIFPNIEDFIFWIRLIPWCNFANLDEILLDYRERPRDNNPNEPMLIADMYYHFYKALGIVSGNRPPIGKY